MALDGKFVTRVIYLEDPHNALPVRNPAGPGQSQTWFDVGPGRDPLAVADGLGRPVAILRLGARVPDQGSDPGFFFGSPPWVGFAPRPAVVRPAAPLARPAPAAAPPPEVVPAPNAAPPGPQP